MPKAQPITATTSCVSCGLPLRPAALFCTGCGTRVEEGGSQAEMACTSCGHALRRGAEFCTECGTAVVSSGAAIDLTGEGGPTTVDSASDATKTQRPAERVSPAASRAILGAVGGGMGSYMGTPKASAASAKPMPELSVAEKKAKRNKVLIGAGVGLVVVLVVAAMMVLALKDDSAHLRAGQGKGTPDGQGAVTGSKKGDKSTTTAADGTTSTGSSTTDDGDSDSKGADTTVAGKKGGKGKTTSKGSTATTHGSTGSSGSTGSKGSAGSGGGKKGGGSSSGTIPAAPPVVTVPGPAILTVRISSIALTGSQPSRSFYVQNTGGRSMSWNASTSGVPGLSLSVTSGTLAPGRYQVVNVVWNSWASHGDPYRGEADEGAWSGSLSVRAGSAGSHDVSVSADNREGDVGTAAYTVDCTPAPGDPGLCRPGSTLRVITKRNAQGDFTGAQPAQVIIAVNSQGATSDWTDIVRDSQKTYPNAAFVFESPKSFRPGSSRAWVQIKDEAGVVGPLTEIRIWP